MSETTSNDLSGLPFVHSPSVIRNFARMDKLMEKIQSIIDSFTEMRNEMRDNPRMAELLTRNRPEANIQGQPSTNSEEETTAKSKTISETGEDQPRPIDESSRLVIDEDEPQASNSDSVIPSNVNEGVESVTTPTINKLIFNFVTPRAEDACELESIASSEYLESSTPKMGTNNLVITCKQCNSKTDKLVKNQFCKKCNARRIYERNKQFHRRVEAEQSKIIDTPRRTRNYDYTDDLRGGQSKRQSKSKSRETTIERLVSVPHQESDSRSPTKRVQKNKTPRLSPTRCPPSSRTSPTKRNLLQVDPNLFSALRQDVTHSGRDPYAFTSDSQPRESSPLNSPTITTKGRLFPKGNRSAFFQPNVARKKRRSSCKTPIRAKSKTTAKSNTPSHEKTQSSTSVEQLRASPIRDDKASILRVTSQIIYPPNGKIAECIDCLTQQMIVAIGRCSVCRNKYYRNRHRIRDRIKNIRGMGECEKCNRIVELMKLRNICLSCRSIERKAERDKAQQVRFDVDSLMVLLRKCSQCKKNIDINEVSINSDVCLKCKVKREKHDYDKCKGCGFLKYIYQDDQCCGCYSNSQKKLRSTENPISRSENLENDIIELSSDDE